ncbi:MAG: pyrroloquinoline quinone-dependent dehydrogenase [Acidobacteriaceae bacterium]|nr:pyrroloquinoline quinone-dependent dehydrogenase [Acidobacteriaceae bacterium]MBV9781035.1 pyrroloquinoline quinone-dependent dehydrogenase [Acidobacteriaceae bacterium]
MLRTQKKALIIFVALSCSALASDWSYYGGDPGGIRFSRLDQINIRNIEKLKKVWEYHTGALQPETHLNHKAAFECTPILVNGVLYLSTPFNQIIALDPATGAEKWKYDPHIDRDGDYSEVASRGVAAWTDTRAQPGGSCKTRLFEGTIDARLIAVDAATGRLCDDFGNHGQVDLTKDVRLRNRGDYQVTSAPTVVGDLVITGSSIGDNRAFDVERGVVRAFHARTGELHWSWDPIPWKPELPAQTGAGNAWAPISADPQRDLIFIPTGSSSPDFYGGMRPGNDEHANAVTALRASTGKLIWSYQVVHHDLWDYDVAAQPALIDFRGRPAVAVATKMGLLFVLDRETGKPLHEVVERPVPKSDIKGEQASPTQPIPAWDGLVPLGLKQEEAWGPTPETRQWCSDFMAKLRNEGFYTPPSLEGTLVFPGNAGGVNWGSVAVDNEHGVLYANTNRLAGMVRLIPRDEYVSAREKAEKNRFLGEFGQQSGTPYAMYREWLITPQRTLCNKPPWGAMVAFDLNTGKRKWETPLGTMIPSMQTGTPNLGGPMLTAGGLVFSAAAMDTYLRAFDAQTGHEVWKAELPASAQSTPMTYRLDDKQYVIICAGGHGKLGSKMGDSVVAFALQ